MTKGKMSKLPEFVVPNATNWVKEALKTVLSHRGQSCGWIWFELFIWIQTSIEIYLEPLKPYWIKLFGKRKPIDDPRFKYSVCHQENSGLFQWVMTSAPHNFDDNNKKTQ